MILGIVLLIVLWLALSVSAAFGLGKAIALRDRRK